MKSHFKLIVYAVMILLVTLMCGCSTKIEANHPALRESFDNNSVALYVLRPKESFNGVRGLPYAIKLDGEKLLTIAKGEYTLVYIKPFSGEITVCYWSVTDRGTGYIIGGESKNTMERHEKTGKFTFEAQRTYYLSFEEVQDGVSNPHIPRLLYVPETGYAPRSLSFFEALRLSKKLKPVGAAIDNPIQIESHSGNYFQPSHTGETEN